MTKNFCRLKAPLGLSLLYSAAQTRTFESASFSVACKKKQGNLWQKEREGWTVPALLTGADTQISILGPHILPT